MQTKWNKSNMSASPVSESEVADSTILSWVNPLLHVQDTGLYGRGVFSKGDILKDTVLMVSGGHVLNTSQLNELGEFATTYNMDISEEYSFCPRTERDLYRMPQHLINHSCEPNAGFLDSQTIVAISDIKKAEEITYDYAFVMWSHPASTSHYTLSCLCGKRQCRGIITEDDWKLVSLQCRYGMYFQPFLQKKFNTDRVSM